MTTMSREANRDSKGLQGRIPNFPKKGKRPGGDKNVCQPQKKLQARRGAKNT